MLIEYRPQTKNKAQLWTEKGLKELGKLIRFNRQSKNLSTGQIVALIEEKTGFVMATRTLNSVETGGGEPKYNTLAAIAASGIVEKDGKTLNIFDFIAIASESYEGMNALTKLITDYLQERNLSLKAFAEVSGVRLPDLQAILEGEETPDYEGDLILIASHIINPNTGRRFHTYIEMLEYCGMKKNPQTGTWEQSHLTNGLG